jgi:hypothetical protein
MGTAVKTVISGRKKFKSKRVFYRTCNYKRKRIITRELFCLIRSKNNLIDFINKRKGCYLDSSFLKKISINTLPIRLRTRRIAFIATIYEDEDGHYFVKGLSFSRFENKWSVCKINVEGLCSTHILVAVAQ